MSLISKVFNNPSRLLYIGVGSFFSLGFYRGCQQYHTKIMKKNNTYDIENSALLVTVGIMNGSLYVNPALCGFALYDEIQKLKNPDNEYESFMSIFPDMR